MVQRFIVVSTYRTSSVIALHALGLLQVRTRNHTQCLQRYKKVLKPGLVKGCWSAVEDARLRHLIETAFFKNWGEVAALMAGRNDKQVTSDLHRDDWLCLAPDYDLLVCQYDSQCRERWTLRLNPNISHTPFTAEEDALLLAEQARRGTLP